MRFVTVNRNDQICILWGQLKRRKLTDSIKISGTYKNRPPGIRDTNFPDSFSVYWVHRCRGRGIPRLIQEFKCQVVWFVRVTNCDLLPNFVESFFLPGRIRCELIEMMDIHDHSETPGQRQVDQCV